MSASTRYEEFQKLQGRGCRLCPGEGADEVAAVLREVGERRERQGYEQFSLLFRAREAGTPRQGLYAVAFDDEPAQEMFLVPVGREDGEVVYEACFNRLQPA